MKALGVLSFVVGVAALGMLAVRRGNNAPMASPDYMLMFIGLAGAIAGLMLFFVYAMQV
jgi:hypothetical protein